MLNRRQFLHSTAMATAAAGAAGPRPNIIMVMTDQQRAGLTRRSGFALDTMPAVDRLAERGVAFDRAYTTAPLCVPARVSLLTGRWPHAHRVRQNSAPKAATFDKDIFQVCHDLGYRTGLCGKNHSYLTESSLDFWRNYSHLDGYIAPGASSQYRDFAAWMRKQNFATGSEPTPFPVEMQFPYRIVSDAIEFVQGSGSQPFALWVSFPEPHNPYQVPQPYFDMFPPRPGAAARGRAGGAPGEGLQMAVAAQASGIHVSGFRHELASHPVQLHGTDAPDRRPDRPSHPPS